MKRMFALLLAIMMLALLGGCNEEKPAMKTVYVLQKEEQTTLKMNQDQSTTKAQTAIQYSYNDKGELVKKVLTDQSVTTTTSYEYDQKGWVLRETVDKNGKISMDYRYTYDDRGNLLVISSANLSGRVVETKMTYDDKNRILTETDMGDPKLSGKIYAYDDEKHIQTVTEYRNNRVTSTTEITTDEQGRILQELKEASRRSKCTYEYEGNVSKKFFWQEQNGNWLEDPREKTLISYYNDSGKLLKEEYCDFNPRTNAYDWVFVSVNYTYDEHGNLTKRTEESYSNFQREPDSPIWVPQYADESITTVYTYEAIQVPAT